MPELGLIVGAVGFAGGVLSGFLGIGGGIVAAPLLLYVPGLLGQPQLSMHTVSGLTITQSLFAGIAGAAAHRRQGTVDRSLVVFMGAVIFAGSLAGAAGSKLLSHRALLGLFLLLAASAAVILFFSAEIERDDAYHRASFSRPAAAAVALAVGILGGAVGQGGSFLLIPMMVSLLGVPLRTAMGSNLAIVAVASAAGFCGKAVTGQIDPLLAAALLAGVIPGTQAGTRLGRRAPAALLRLLLGVVLLLACIRIFADLVG